MRITYELLSSHNNHTTIMNNIEEVLKSGYIDGKQLSTISQVNKRYIMENWVYVKNKHTNKEYYIIPVSNGNNYNKTRFELLKVACEHQPETLEEKWLREAKL